MRLLHCIANISPWPFTIAVIHLYLREKVTQILLISTIPTLMVDNSIRQWPNAIKFSLHDKAEVLAEELIIPLYLYVWKKAGKLCKGMTMAYFYVLVHFNNYLSCNRIRLPLPYPLPVGKLQFTAD